MSNMLMSQRDIQFSKLNVLKVTTERFVTKDHDPGGVLDQWLGIGVPLRVSNPDPV